MNIRGASGAFGAGAVVLAGGYLGLVTGAVPIDLGIGRRIRPLGPAQVEIAAPREVVFDVLAEPYLARQTRAMAEKIEIMERGSDMVLAAHRTPLRRGLVATTVETVRFSRPHRVDFRLTRGPVPHVVEQFVLTAIDGRTRLAYQGELGTDLWALGARWGDIVADRGSAPSSARSPPLRPEPSGGPHGTPASGNQGDRRRQSRHVPERDVVPDAPDQGRQVPVGAGGVAFFDARHPTRVLARDALRSLGTTGQPPRSSENPACTRAMPGRGSACGAIWAARERRF